MSSDLPNQKLNQAEITFVQCLLASYERLFNKVLIQRNSEEQDYFNLFHSDFYLVSHRFMDVPRFVFGTEKAIQLWETSWKDFYMMPSKYSAEEDQREKREQMLKSANEKGYFDGYEGVRISAKGNRFKINNVLIFNVFEEGDKVIGQAALFYDTTPVV